MLKKQTTKTYLLAKYGTEYQIAQHWTGEEPKRVPAWNLYVLCVVSTHLLVIEGVHPTKLIPKATIAKFYKNAQKSLNNT